MSAQSTSTTPSFITRTDPFAAVLALPSCRLGMRVSHEEKITGLAFLPPETALFNAGQAHGELIQMLENAIKQWLKHPAHIFELPLSISGTPFQQRVWQAISSIPCGEIRTYGELSAEVGGTARAVGQACGANPIPVVVPCHRVVAKTGLGGFARARDGWLLETKRWLLKHEGVL